MPLIGSRLHWNCVVAAGLSAFFLAKASATATCTHIRLFRPCPLASDAHLGEGTKNNEGSMHIGNTLQFH
jgi:hypothetical protein